MRSKPAGGSPRVVATAPPSMAEARILVVDDEPANVRLLESLLARAGYRSVVGSTDGREAARLAGRFDPDLVLLDLHMPHVDGVEVLCELRESAVPHSYLPVIVLTADTTAGAMERVLAAGAVDLITKPFDVLEVLLRIRNHLEVRFLHTHMEELVRERTRELEASHHEMISRLAQAAEFRDDATGQHIRRVAELSAALAAAIGLPAHQVDLIQAAAPLHDIGKIAIPDAILLKSGALTVEEANVMRRHPTVGARLLSGGTSELLAVAKRIAASHHEWWDGGGYPDGLAGEAIPLEARIVAVADVFDALTHERPYRPAWREGRAIEEITDRAGSHLDPRIVQALMAILGRRVGVAHLVARLGV